MTGLRGSQLEIKTLFEYTPKIIFRGFPPDIWQSASTTQVNDVREVTWKISTLEDGGGVVTICYFSYSLNWLMQQLFLFCSASKNQKQFIFELKELFNPSCIYTSSYYSAVTKHAVCVCVCVTENLSISPQSTPLKVQRISQ